jgi:hypothetical protein
MKNWLQTQHSNNNEKLTEGVKTWLISGIQKLIPCYNKGFNSGSNYDEKQLKYTIIFFSSHYYVNSSMGVTLWIAIIISSLASEIPTL